MTTEKTEKTGKTPETCPKWVNSAVWNDLQWDILTQELVKTMGKSKAAEIIGSAMLIWDNNPNKYSPFYALMVTFYQLRNISAGVYMPYKDTDNKQYSNGKPNKRVSVKYTQDLFDAMTNNILNGTMARNERRYNVPSELNRDIQRINAHNNDCQPIDYSRKYFDKCRKLADIENAMQTAEKSYMQYGNVANNVIARDSFKNAVKAMTDKQVIAFQAVKKVWLAGASDLRKEADNTSYMAMYRFCKGIGTNVLDFLEGYTRACA